MMERMVEPDARDRVQCPVRPPLDGAADHLEGTRIAQIGVRRIAEQVPRELIEQQDQRESTLGRILPVPEFAGDGARQKIAEPGADFVVDRLAALVPEFAPREGGLEALQAVAEPERRDVIDDFAAHDRLLPDLLRPRRGAL